MKCSAKLAASAAALMLPCLLHDPARAESAEAFPSKPVRVVLAQATGGATDIQSRLFAARMSELLGQQFVVDNRAGGGAAAVLAFSLVAKANRDGYTLLAVIPTLTFAPALDPSYPIDPLRDFAPVSLLTRAPYLLVVNAGLPVGSVRELIAAAHAEPGKLNFGAGNTGSGTHLVTLWFMTAAKINALYVPYRSVGVAMLDLAGGRIDATLANVLSASQHIRSGKLKALGISTDKRSRVLPDLPTIAEQGATGFNASTFHGYAVPAGTPPAIIDKLAKTYKQAVSAPDVGGKLLAEGAEPIGSTPSEFGRFLEAEIKIWRAVVKESGVKLK